VTSAACYFSLNGRLAIRYLRHILSKRDAYAELKNKLGPANNLIVESRYTGHIDRGLAREMANRCILTCREYCFVWRDEAGPGYGIDMMAAWLKISVKADLLRETIVKLLPLPQPPLRARTDAHTNPSAQRATQLRSVLARVYAVARQNQSTNNVP
jgi:hypothetical protein